MDDPTSHGPIAEIRNEPSAMDQFLERNQKILIALVVLGVLAICAWVVMRGMKEGADHSGGTALVAAEDMAAYQDVIKNHADSPAAPSAEVLLSDLQWEQGQQDAAIETLQAVISDDPDHPAAIPARARLGARLAQQGKNDEASRIFEALVSDPAAQYLAPYALSRLAQIAKNQGQLDRAESYLHQAAEEFPGNPLSQAAAQARQFLHFEMPEEIDPPPPEETPVPDEVPPTPFENFTNPDAGAAPVPPTEADGPPWVDPVDPDASDPPSGGEPSSEPTPEAPNTTEAGE